MKQSEENLKKELSNLKAKRAFIEKRLKLVEEIAQEREKIKEINPNWIQRIFRGRT